MELWGIHIPRKLDTWTIYFYTETTREVLLFIETDTVCGSTLRGKQEEQEQSQRHSNLSNCHPPQLPPSSTSFHVICFLGRSEDSHLKEGFYFWMEQNRNTREGNKLYSEWELHGAITAESSCVLFSYLCTTKKSFNHSLHMEQHQGNW